MTDSIQANRRPWHHRLGLQSLRVRIVLSMAGLITLIAVIVGGTVWVTFEYRATATEVETHALISDRLSMTVTDGAFGVAEMQLYIVTGDPELLALSQENFASAQIALQEAAAALQAAGRREDAVVIERFIADSAALTIPLAQAVALTQAGDQAGAAAAGIEFFTSAQAIDQDLIALSDGELAAIRESANNARTVTQIAFYAAIVTGIGSVLLLTAAAWLITRSIVRPLTDLRLTALAVGEGDLTARAKVAGPMEVRNLGTVLNSMTTQIKQRETDAIAQIAYHDELTGLPNRRLLQDRFEIAMTAALRGGERVCALSVDIDRFKVVNDTLGHTAGDVLLREAAGRLKNLVRAGDTVARQGGDEFLLLLAGVDSSESGEAMAERIVEAFHQPIELEGIEYHSTVSVGLAIYPEDGANAEALTNAADAAMHAAKDAGRDTFRVYNAGMSRHGRDWIELETELRRALQAGEIEVFYQPQVRIDSSEIVGVEALARWRHPARGLISPAEFIPIAEETGLIVPLGEQVLTSAISDFMQWDADGIAPRRLSVNVSAHQIERPDFVQRIAAILTDTGLPPGRLDLEITETTVLKDVPHTREVGDELAAMGVSIAIDDFGTGSTSLRYLSDLPVGTVKIDLMFVRDMIENPSSAAIVTSVIALGHQLSLNVIAEGVETKRQLAALRRHACDEFQGFLSSRPIPAREMRQFLETSEIRESVQGEAAEGSAAAPIAT